jgi:hypothetical protein
MESFVNFDEMSIALRAFHAKPELKRISSQCKNATTYNIPKADIVAEFLDADDEDAFAEDWAQEHGGLPRCGCKLLISIRGQHIGARSPNIRTTLVAMPDAASWEIPGLSIRQESFAHAGFRGTVEGLLAKVEKDILMMRPGFPPQQQQAIDAFLESIHSFCHCDSWSAESECLQLCIRDPSGLSVVDGEHQGGLDWVARHNFERTWAEEEELGLFGHDIALPSLQLSTAEEVAELVRGKKRVVVLSGAGISVESGVTPFRTPDPVGSEVETGGASAPTSGSIWGRFDAKKLTVQGFNNSEDIVEEWWAMKHFILPEIRCPQAVKVCNFSNQSFFSFLVSTKACKSKPCPPLLWHTS